MIYYSFNSRTREGCDGLNHGFYFPVPFQFTHPRGVRFEVFHGHSSFLGFNSRTREGCDAEQGKRDIGHVFQFTHPRGVRFLPGLLRRRRRCFNSRTREGCDGRTKIVSPPAHVSIHAPARGAMKFYPLQGRHSCFNSRTREGCDTVSVLAVAPVTGFNSRTREGCDLVVVFVYVPGWVSIHAPARGAMSRLLPMMAGVPFQFTHPRGVR